MKEKAILFVYGVGGHKEEMQRLLKHLNIKHDTMKMVAICEKNSKMEGFDYSVEVPRMRSKYVKNMAIIEAIYSSFKSIYITLTVLKKYDINCLISTGPGLVIPISILFKLLFKKIIFIETWCRFDSKSLTGKVMHVLANVFYVQNKSLLSLYKKAVYSGRL